MMRGGCVNPAGRCGQGNETWEASGCFLPRTLPPFAIVGLDFDLDLGLGLVGIRGETDRHWSGPYTVAYIL